jgi:hypothetical protein
MPARSDTSIPVKVVVERSSAPIAPKPVVPRPKPKPAVKPVAATPKPARPVLEDLPLAHRKKLMWVFVAVGMFVAVSLWALSLGAELRQDNARPNVLTEVASLFRSFKFRDNPPASPKETEIEKLEEQVFPQFE